MGYTQRLHSQALDFPTHVHASKKCEGGKTFSSLAIIIAFAHAHVGENLGVSVCYIIISRPYAALARI